MMKGREKFPFHYIRFNEIEERDGETKEIKEMPFIQQVKHALGSNMQDPNVFGCKIKNCHTHAGSKIHFNDFIEAELLFHNSYYNHHFAQLTLQSIKELLRNKYKDVREIVLIGYENYSELYLQELNRLLEDELKKEKKRRKCRYCVYETISECKPDGSRVNKASIRDGNKEISKASVEKSLHFFIVSINTSLSTMDKMMSEYWKHVEARKQRDTGKEFLYECLCLITLGKSEEDSDDDSQNLEYEYWEYKEEGECFPTGRLCPIPGRFQYIGKEVINFVLFEGGWRNAKQCQSCFPDKGYQKKSILSETPMFGVNRGSVVPMLKIGKSNYLKPIDPEQARKCEENIKRIWKLSDCLCYNHVFRGENHFQYYFDTEKFLAENKEDIKDSFLKKVKQEFDLKKDEMVFDFIVAPRHHTNAGWVHLVNECVFGGTARVMYFDVDKEYRSNIKAKYSDLTSALENIQVSEQDFKIRFHFVDDTIHSGANFLRAKNLVTSLTTGIKERTKLFLFESAILLINRLSLDTKRFYVETGKVKSYVDVNISPMRRHDDACTLCKLIFDYHIIKNECATNEMADVCRNVIKSHKGKDASILFGIKKEEKSIWNEIEKRYVFLISHLLNERMNNRFSLGLGEKKDIDSLLPINGEDGCQEIEKILELFYNNGNAIFNMCIKKSKKKVTQDEEYSECLWKVALIKAISRPFFIYHIRQRQAAFSFCLRELNAELYSPDIGIGTDEEKWNGVLIKTLVKALSDMNANYLIRKEILEKLIEYAKYGDNQFSEVDLIHYIKRTITLSRDFTKSLLLEYILLFDSENAFFEEEVRTVEVANIKRDSMIERFIEKNEAQNSRLTIYGKLYLENNTILKDMLGKDNNLDKVISYAFPENNNVTKDLYFMSNFIELWNLNSSNKAMFSKNIYIAYKQLRDKIKSFAGDSEVDRVDFSGELNKFLDKICERNGGNAPRLRALFFVQDQKEKTQINEIIPVGGTKTEQDLMVRKQAPLFRFFTLAGDPAESKERLECRYEGISTSQAFFYDGNVVELNRTLDKNASSSIFFIRDELSKDENAEALIVRFGTEIMQEEIPEKENSIGGPSVDADYTDQSIYVQIWGFDKQRLEHWFSLKLLLTLREEIVEVIEKVNLNQLIESRKVAMQKSALSISKASTHSQAEKYFAEMLITQGISRGACESENTIEKNIISTITSDVKNMVGDKPVKVNGIDWNIVVENAVRTWSQHDIYDSIMQVPIHDLSYRWIMYDKYYQLLADEFISSLYRKRIRNEECFSENLNALDLEKSLVRILGMKDGKVVLTTHVNSSLVRCQITFELGEDCKIKNRYRSESGIDVYVFIILLVAMNVCEHENNPKLKVRVSNAKLIFENDVSDFHTVTNRKKYWHIPPWLFPKSDQHISLWTLGHLYRQSGAWVDARFRVEEESKKFISEFEFKGEKK